jgi:hypothetical protein
MNEMENNAQSSNEGLRLWGEYYFKSLLKEVPANLGMGNELKIGFTFRREDGSWSSPSVVMTILKSDLKDK